MNSQLKQDFRFFIDVVGTCNLSCPSCPVGNSREVRNPRGLMTAETLDKIMKKAISECNVTGVALYNWTEPLLHPRLPDLIRIVQQYQVPCAISTNLNYLKNADALMNAAPHSLYISLSGFSQEIYGLTHKRGNVEKVKKNIMDILEAKRRTGSTTTMTIIFHRYRHNQADELRMRQFAEDNGIRFMTSLALITPLEKVLSFAELGESSLSTEDIEVVRNLALPLDQALEVAKQYRESPCKLRDQQVTLNVSGDVTLCCAVFDSQQYGVANYLTTPLTEIQRRRRSNPLCTRCIRIGGHVYTTYASPEFERLADANRH